uniref:Uncharacterized protein n=1 Tax=Myoviridae sp. ctCo31 TaxID=2825053 RepID=A0A8S5UM86_9CAUD|nr:MAG TPA: hypothetical protein [Myoviridae sp. ctCo31]
MSCQRLVNLFDFTPLIVFVWAAIIVTGLEVKDPMTSLILITLP